MSIFYAKASIAPHARCTQDAPSVNLAGVFVRFTRIGSLLIDKGINLSSGESILLFSVLKLHLS
jgi:hypothetical protein